MKQAYYEIRPIRPKLDRLKHMLEENKYSGDECENDEHHKGCKVSNAFNFSH